MKKNVLILLFFAGIFSGINGQILNDSTKFKLNYLIESNYNLQKDLNEVKINLRQFHEVYQAGLCISAIGVGIAGIAVYYNQHPAALYSGGAFILIGAGTIIYSHTYIGKAGVGIGENGLTVKYNF